MMPTESGTAAIHVDEGVEATPELLSIVEGRYFLPGERVRALPGTRLSDESDADAAARWTALPRNADLVVAATWLVQGTDGEPRVSYAFEGHSGLHPAAAFGDPRPFHCHYGVMIHRGGSIFLIPFDDRAEHVVEASGPPVRIAERLCRSARYSLGVGGGAEEAGLFFAGLETVPQTGEFHILDNGDGTADLAYTPWWTDASSEEVSIAQDAIASAGYPAAPAPRN
jgi:hypothetical protein